MKKSAKSNIFVHFIRYSWIKIILWILLLILLINGYEVVFSFIPKHWENRDGESIRSGIAVLLGIITTSLIFYYYTKYEEYKLAVLTLVSLDSTTMDKLKDLRLSKYYQNRDPLLSTFLLVRNKRLSNTLHPQVGKVYDNIKNMRENISLFGNLHDFGEAINEAISNHIPDAIETKYPEQVYNIRANILYYLQSYAINGKVPNTEDFHHSPIVVELLKIVMNDIYKNNSRYNPTTTTFDTKELHDYLQQD